MLLNLLEKGTRPMETLTISVHQIQDHWSDYQLEQQVQMHFHSCIHRVSEKVYTLLERSYLC